MNTLKRPRPLGHEPEPVEALVNPSPLVTYPSYDIQFTDLPTGERINIEQTAAIYGLTGVQLHCIVWNSISSGTSDFDPSTHHSKRLRVNYPFVPHQLTHEFGGGDTDRMSHIPSSSHELEQVGPNPSLDGPYPLGLDSSRIASSLASLKDACQTCLTRCDGHDSYYAIAVPRPYDYEPSRPYVVEKPPSMGVIASGDFINPVLKTHSPPSFVDEAIPSTRYLASYPALQPSSQAGVGRVDPRDQMGYTSQPSPTGYYDNEAHFAPALALRTELPRSETMLQQQTMASSHLSPQFANPLTHRPLDAEPDDALPRFANVAEYHGRAPLPVDPASYCDPMPHSSALDGLLTSPLNRPAARRGPFKNNDDREKTAQTRKIGSCVRCRMQRIRCFINPTEPNGPCLTCQKVSANTKIRRLPCLRYKITDVRLFKPGQVRGYEWTRRWRDNMVDNISHWASDEIKVIHVSEGYTRTPVELRVRQFCPQEGDKLTRSWVANGSKKSVDIPPYAIVDLEAARKAYSEHIDDGIIDSFSAVVKSRNDLIWNTYVLAFKMARDASLSRDERDLLSLALRLWTAVRLTTKSTVIVGNERLGMPPDIMDESSPIHGCIPLPPVMGAQLDLILIHQIQSALRREMLDKLQKMIQTNKQKTWLTTYLVMFILLHNVALITNHDAGYARKHGMNKRYAREDKVREYHLGANILLAYFHYCNKGIYPFSNDCKEQDLRTLAELDESAIRFVKETRSFASDHKRQWQRLHQEGLFEDDYFFLSQLFTENWEPRSTV